MSEAISPPLRAVHAGDARAASLPLARAWALSRRFPFGYQNHYVFCKLVMDPVYAATLASLRAAPPLPLLDIGCGPGLLSLYLRAHGFAPPIHGIDYDPRKTETAAAVLAGFADCTFAPGDAREGLPEHSGHVSILDILQFFTPDEVRALVTAAAARVAPGGRLVIRTCLRDEGWRFRLTRAGDWLAKVTFWMKDHASHYPSREELTGVLEAAGLRGTVRRLSGRLPFNNFFIDFGRES